MLLQMPALMYNNLYDICCNQSFFSPLYEPKPFHTGNYTEIVPQTKNPIEVGFILDEIGNFRVKWGEVR